MTRTCLVAFLIGLCATSAATAAELRVHHGVIRRFLAQQVFTEDGRKYLRGSRTARCNYAWLEHPEISEHDGQLVIRARFTGRTDLDIFGKCIGLGDSFQARIFATPYYRDGAVRVKDVRVESEDRDSFYIRRVRSALAGSLPDALVFRVYDQAKALLEEHRPNQGWKQELAGFSISGIRVTKDQVIFTLDFAVVVK